jgi:cytochrome oxidase Cu insertion factor (SCO1/SenC/PrrC family)
MRFWPKIIVLATFLFLVSCGGESRPSTPIDTFKAYTAAIKRKDLTTMKLLLSESSRKMHEQEARARGVTLDDVIKTQTLFREDQTSVKLRNEKIDGDKATLEVQNSYGDWETLPFVKEEGIWKIDKQGFADQIIQDVDQKDKELEDRFNRP